MARGHVLKRGQKWAYVHWFNDPATGKRRQRWKGGFDTKRDAERELRKALTTIDTGTFVEPSKLTFGSYVVDCWLPVMRGQVEGSTLESYQRNLALHVIPRIGGVSLSGLRPSHLNALYADLLAGANRMPTESRWKHPLRVYELVRTLRENGSTYEEIAIQIVLEVPGQDEITRHAVARIWARMQTAKPPSGTGGPLSVRTVRYVHTIISGALEDALKEGWVARNVARAASPPPPPKERVRRTLWTGDQTRRFLEWCADQEHRLTAAWTFVATSGDRRGANLGLRWSDIDLEAGRATLSWNVTSVRHKVVVKPYTKTGDGHEILLDTDTVAVLRAWRARQAQERLAMGIPHVCESTEPGCDRAGYHHRDLVFCRLDGDYLHPERFTREFQRTQARFNRVHPGEELPAINLHALRHGWATLALESGVAMKVVQDRLNHSSERVTSDIYTHVRAPLQSDAAERVARAIFGSARPG